MTPMEAKIKVIINELSQKLMNKEITSKDLFECLDEIEKFKLENGIMNPDWRIQIKC